MCSPKIVILEYIFISICYINLSMVEEEESVEIHVLAKACQKLCALSIYYGILTFVA